MRIIHILLLSMILVLSACTGSMSISGEPGPLEGIRITIDPGHGATEAYDHYRVGPAGEREEWINLRVAKILNRKLRMAGAEVLMTRTQDKDVSLGGRATLAKLHDSDLLVSIHHNGSGNDPQMDLPIVYFFGPASMNPASVDFAKILIQEMRDTLTFQQPDAGSVYSDHLIYSSGTAILRNSISHLPGVIGEAGFFTNARGEARLKSRKYNALEAEVYYQSILKYVEKGLPSATPVVADSLDYLDLNQTLFFEMDDGFGSNFFDESQFLVLQDGDTLQTEWDSYKGLLAVHPLPREEHSTRFQVFGRNFKGNALHPKVHTYRTKAGHDWYAVDSWREAWELAEKVASRIDILGGPDQLDLIDEALHFYQLSLDLQIVHAKARLAEEAILALLIMKDGFGEEDLSEEISAQTYRLNQLYPE